MENFEQLKETQLSSREIFNGRIMHVFEDTVRLPNGEAASREYMRHVGAVCVIPVFENGDVIMEQQYRYPVGEVITEIPAGKLESKAEDHLLAAQRELREETGCTAKQWTSLGVFYPACAYSDEAIEMFLARDLSMGEQALDEDEFLHVTRIPLTQLLSKVMAGEIPDAKTQIAVLKAAHILREEGFNGL
ncbi:MAG: NUDIX hydrolase [Oscillospiraceae bacterium]|nr:NUDIX hydrolase [Oscillospiraceae bacterium]